MDRRHFSLSMLLAASCVGSSAQTRVVKIIIPFAPGGITDVIAREIASTLSRLLGVTVIADNRAGAGGSIGASEVARAAPDGNVLGLATQSTHAFNPAVYTKLPYDPIKDFTVIGEIAEAPAVLLIRPGIPAKDLESFIAYARANPGKLSYSSPGSGTHGHISGEQFKHAAGVRMVHIPYRGATPALADLLSGVVDATFTSVPSSLAHIQAGKVRALAVSWPQRLSILPSVPTYAEGGMKQLNVPLWYALVGPANMPVPVVRSLQQALAAALKQPELQQKYLGQGLTASTLSPEEFQAVFRRDIVRARDIARDANIVLD